MSTEGSVGKNAGKGRESAGQKERPRKPAMSVYISPEIGQILGGGRSYPYGCAIRCWATLLAPASLENEQELDPRDWQMLARAWADREHSIAPESTQPGELLADGLVRWVIDGGARAAGFPEKEVRELAAWIRGLDYVRAWAIVFALQYRRHYFLPAEGPEAWWSMAHRRSTVAARRR